MPDQLKVELSQGAQKILADLKAMPRWALQAIADGMQKANELTISHIQAKHLTGRGPFPVEEHRLGVVTNNLRVQVWASKPVIEGMQVTSSIGDPVKYAAIHEFGGVIHFAARARNLRFKMKATKAGLVPKTQRNSHLWVFARRKDTVVHEMTAQSKPYDVTIPARAPFGTGVEERMPAAANSIGAALVRAWKNQSKT